MNEWMEEMIGDDIWFNTAFIYGGALNCIVYEYIF